MAADFADEVTNYTNNTTITLDGKAITADKVGRGQTMESYNITFRFPSDQCRWYMLFLTCQKKVNWPVKSNSNQKRIWNRW